MITVVSVELLFSSCHVSWIIFMNKSSLPALHSINWRSFSNIWYVLPSERDGSTHQISAKISSKYLLDGKDLRAVLHISWSQLDLWKKYWNFMDFFTDLRPRAWWSIIRSLNTSCHIRGISCMPLYILVGEILLIINPLLITIRKTQDQIEQK